MPYQSAIAACTRLIHSYAITIDFNDLDSFSNLFSETATLNVGRPVTGRANIRASLDRRPTELRSRHVLTNVVIDILDASRAQGLAYLSLYRHMGPESLSDAPIDTLTPAAVGHYDYRFEKTSKGWRFANVSIALAFRNPDLF
jgi:hypothetical protein